MLLCYKFIMLLNLYIMYLNDTLLMNKCNFMLVLLLNLSIISLIAFIL